MTTAATIETLPLEEVQNLGWPTDPNLVQSFRRTLQRGSDFALIQINRVWHPDTTWHHEIIDGFHRYEAAQAEGIASLLFQVVELEEREARYARIQACVGKPSVVTEARALLELRQAFIQDMRAIVGQPEMLFEPLIGEDGRIYPRPRNTPLPDEPIAALEALTNHLQAIQEQQLPPVVSENAGMSERRKSPPQTGWEPVLQAWLADLGKRFGYNASWLISTLRLSYLREHEVGQDGTAHQQKAFMRHGGFRAIATALWQIPDVELRAWLRQQILAHPGSQDDLGLLMMYLGFRERRPNDPPFQTYSRSLLWKVFKRYPDPRALLRVLRAHHPNHLPLDPSVLEGLLEKPLPPVDSGATLPPPQSEERRPIVTPFSVASSGFVQRTLPSPREPSAFPTIPLRVESESAYQPVHEAIQMALGAMQRLNASYDRAWLRWDCAQADLANLLAAITPDEDGIYP